MAFGYDTVRLSVRERTRSKPGGGLRTIRSASLRGKQRCQSKHECLLCAQAACASDAEDLMASVDGWRIDGGEVYMVSLTVPHRRGQDYQAFVKRIAQAYSNMLKGKGWDLLMERHGIRASVRCIETTHGHHGWHPHIHALMFARPGVELEQLRAEFFKRWVAGCRKAKIDLPSETSNRWVSFERHGVDARNANQAASYLAKMGIAWEIAAEAKKEARCSGCSARVSSTWRDGRRRCDDCGCEVNRTAFQIGIDYHLFKNPRDAALWMEYCRGIRGTKRLTWSGGKSVPLRERYAGYTRKWRMAKGKRISQLVPPEPTGSLLFEFDLPTDLVQRMEENPHLIALFKKSAASLDVEAMGAIMGDERFDEFWEGLCDNIALSAPPAADRLRRLTGLAERGEYFNPVAAPPRPETPTEPRPPPAREHPHGPRQAPLPISIEDQAPEHFMGVG